MPQTSLVMARVKWERTKARQNSLWIFRIADGGKERIPGGQNRHQDTQQDDGSRSAEQNRRQTPGPGGGVSGGGQGGKEGAQPAEQIAQQQAKAFPEHSGTEPRQRCGTGKSDGMDRQQHQQRQQVPQPEIPV